MKRREDKVEIILHHLTRHYPKIKSQGQILPLTLILHKLYLTPFISMLLNS